MEKALVNETESTVCLGDYDFDYKEGQTLVEVFGKDVKLLNEKGNEVQNAIVASSLRPN